MCLQIACATSGKLREEGPLGKALGGIFGEICHYPVNIREPLTFRPVVEKTFPSMLKGKQAVGSNCIRPGESPREGWLWLQTWLSLLTSGGNCQFLGTDTHQKVKPQPSCAATGGKCQRSHTFVSGSFLFADDSTRLIPVPQKKQQLSAGRCGSLVTTYEMACQTQELLCNLVIWREYQKVSLTFMMVHGCSFLHSFLWSEACQLL